MSSTLLLNANFEPISILPLSVISWEQAVKLIFLEKVLVIEEYDDWVLHSAGGRSIKVPAVCVTKEYFNSKKAVRFTRRNLYLRDLYTCQYCAETFATKDLTVDHVLPRAAGGKTSWTNCVAACLDCNAKKADRRDMRPIRKAYEPSYYNLVNIWKKTPFVVRHPSWAQYLGVAHQAKAA